MSLFLCGDCHGHYNRMIKIGRKHRPLIFLGDIGFKYGFLKQYDSSETYLLGGNHDNYDEIIHLPQFLGHSGRKEIAGIDFFFVRGAYSTDKEFRVNRITWWQEEELNYTQCSDCIIQYYLEKPDIVLAHDFPSDIIPILFNPNPRFPPSNTQKLLQNLMEIHQPKLYIGGHWHTSRDQMINGTRFICLNELEVFELNGC